MKPDLTAPGVDITSAASAASGAGETYVAKSGTSMASPHAAGAAALLAQLRPDWTGPQIKSALVGSATPGDHTAYEQGTGRVDTHVRRVRGTDEDRNPLRTLVHTPHRPEPGGDIARPSPV